MSAAEGRQLCAELGLQGLAWEPGSVSSSCFLETSGQAVHSEKRRGGGEGRRRKESKKEEVKNNSSSKL